MIVCAPCKREMLCDKNGVGVDFGGGHVYASDRWRCPSCGQTVCTTNDQPHYDRDYSRHDEYLRMNDDK